MRLDEITNHLHDRDSSITDCIIHLLSFNSVTSFRRCRIFRVFSSMRLSRTSEFLILSRRFMRQTRSLQISCIWSLNHIRQVSSHVVQFFVSSRSMIIHAIKYDFIILIIFSWAEIDLYLFRRFVSVQRKLFLFLDISSIESMSSSSSTIDFRRDCDDSCDVVRSNICLKFYELSIVFNDFKTFITISWLNRERRVDMISSSFESSSIMCRVRNRFENDRSRI
jgi:hypothetical protein